MRQLGEGKNVLYFEAGLATYEKYFDDRSISPVQDVEYTRAEQNICGISS